MKKHSLSVILIDPHNSAILAHPIELLKGTCIRDSIVSKKKKLTTCTVNLQLQRERATKDRKFKGPIDCIRQVVGTNGVQGLWRGFGGSLAFRSSFFFMFVRILGLPSVVHLIELSHKGRRRSESQSSSKFLARMIYCDPQVLMRAFGRLQGTPYEVCSSI